MKINVCVVHGVESVNTNDDAYTHIFFAYATNIYMFL